MNEPPLTPEDHAVLMAAKARLEAERAKGRAAAKSAEVEEGKRVSIERSELLGLLEAERKLLAKALEGERVALATELAADRIATAANLARGHRHFKYEVRALYIIAFGIVILSELNVF